MKHLLAAVIILAAIVLASSHAWAVRYEYMVIAQDQYGCITYVRPRTSTVTSLMKKLDPSARACKRGRTPRKLYPLPKEAFDLSIIGKDGWELVSVVPVLPGKLRGDLDKLLFFKRRTK